MQMREYSRVRI